MKQLSGLDASFLYMETPTTFGHVSFLGVFERPTPDFDPFEAAYRRFGAVVGSIEPLRRRLVEVPYSLDHPYWIDDPDFDLDFHIRHIAIPPPGGVDQLAEQVARIVGRPMDRDHPLWEVYVIEGLADGRWAMLTKLHHATIDGASGVMFLELLTDTEPDTAPPEPVEWQGEAVPSYNELLTRTATALITNPLKGWKLQNRIMRNMAAAAGISGLDDAATKFRETVSSALKPGSDRPAASPPYAPAPPTPWNRSISAHRRFAMRSASLANIKALKDATGGTVNDVVLAICAGALREYLLLHDALPDQPLRAMIPVSIRTGDETDPWTNRISSLTAELPTDCDDPLERVRRCSEAMGAAKRQFELVPADALVDAAEFSSPVVATAASRYVTNMNLGDQLSRPANLVISNVPGPRNALYFEGAKMDHYIPVSTINEGMGLNITVLSYLDHLDFGFIASRELIPDLWDMADLHIDEIARLFDATGATWVEPQTPPSMRRGGSRA